MDTCDIEEHGDNTKIKVNNIPENITLELGLNNTATYLFLGAVEIKSHVNMASRNEYDQFRALGHYEAVCRRFDGNFIRCNDMARSATGPLNVERMRKTMTFIPEILIYSLIE